MDAKRLPLTEISLPCSNANKPNTDVSIDEDNLSLNLQETRVQIAGVSEFERGLALIANRKMEEENRERKKDEGLSEAQEKVET